MLAIFPFSPPWQNHNRIFVCVWYLLWKPDWTPGGQFHHIVCLPLPSPHDWVPLAFLTLSIVHTKPSAICQLQFRLPTPTLVSSLVSTVFALVNCDSLYLPIWMSSLGGNGLPCVLSTFIDSGRIYFSVCSVI